MNIDLHNRLYIDNGCVYFGYTQLEIKNQRGRLFIIHKRKQINIKNIPRLPEEEREDYVFDYIFRGGFELYSCPAFDYWILRWRLKKKITIGQYKKEYLKNTKNFYSLLKSNRNVKASFVFAS